MKPWMKSMYVVALVMASLAGDYCFDRQVKPDIFIFSSFYLTIGVLIHALWDK